MTLVNKVPEPEGSKKISWLQILVFLILVLIVVAVFNFFKGNDSPELKQMQEKITAYQQRSDSLQQEILSLSAELSEINNKIAASNEAIQYLDLKINNTKNAYVQKRNDTRTLPTDEQFKLFSGWLSEIDSSRH